MIVVSETDKIKEEIGWLKILLGLLVAVDIPLIAWIVGHFATASFVLCLAAIILAILVSCAMIMVNFRAYSEISKLRDL